MSIKKPLDFLLKIIYSEEIKKARNWTCKLHQRLTFSWWDETSCEPGQRWQNFIFSMRQFQSGRRFWEGTWNVQMKSISINRLTEILNIRYFRYLKFLLKTPSSGILVEIYNLFRSPDGVILRIKNKGEYSSNCLKYANRNIKFDMTSAITRSSTLSSINCQNRPSKSQSKKIWKG